MLLGHNITPLIIHYKIIKYLIHVCKVYEFGGDVG